LNELLANFIDLLIMALTFAILGRVIMSWVTMFAPTSTMVQAINQLLNQVTEPILAPLRRVIPNMGAFDLTPMIALILLQFIGPILTSVLRTT